MLSTVAIDVPAEVTPAEVAPAVSRCSQVLGRDRCKLSQPGTPEVRTTFTARIVWEDADRSSLRMVFLRTTGSGEPLAERTLAFSKADASASRWAAAGLVVAGLVAAFDVPPAPSERANPPPNQPARRTRTGATRSRLLGLDAGVIAGPALDEVSWRAGGLVRGWYGFAGDEHVLALAGLRYLGQLEAPTLHWASLALGLATRLGARDALVQAELAGELVGERVMLWATDPETGLSDSAQQHRFGGRLGMNVALRATRSLGLVVGLEASALTPPTKIVVRDEVIGREHAAQFAVWSGLRLAL